MFRHSPLALSPLSPLSLSLSHYLYLSIVFCRESISKRNNYQTILDSYCHSTNISLCAGDNPATILFLERTIMVTSISISISIYTYLSLALSPPLCLSISIFLTYFAEKVYRSVTAIKLFRIAIVSLLVFLSVMCRRHELPPFNFSKRQSWLPDNYFQIFLCVQQTWIATILFFERTIMVTGFSCFQFFLCLSSSSFHH